MDVFGDYYFAHHSPSITLCSFRFYALIHSTACQDSGRELPLSWYSLAHLPAKLTPLSFWPLVSPFNTILGPVTLWCTVFV